MPDPKPRNTEQREQQIDAAINEVEVADEVGLYEKYDAAVEVSINDEILQPNKTLQRQDILGQQEGSPVQTLEQRLFKDFSFCRSIKFYQSQDKQRSYLLEGDYYGTQVAVLMGTSDNTPQRNYIYGLQQLQVQKIIVQNKEGKYTNLVERAPEKTDFFYLQREDSESGKIMERHTRGEGYEGGIFFSGIEKGDDLLEIMHEIGHVAFDQTELAKEIEKGLEGIKSRGVRRTFLRALDKLVVDPNQILEDVRNMMPEYNFSNFSALLQKLPEVIEENTISERFASKWAEREASKVFDVESDASMASLLRGVYEKYWHSYDLFIGPEGFVSDESIAHFNKQERLLLSEYFTFFWEITNTLSEIKGGRKDYSGSIEEDGNVFTLSFDRKKGLAVRLDRAGGEKVFGDLYGLYQTFTVINQEKGGLKETPINLTTIIEAKDSIELIPEVIPHLREFLDFSKKLLQKENRKAQQSTDMLYEVFEGSSIDIRRYDPLIRRQEELLKEGQGDTTTTIALFPEDLAENPVLRNDRIVERLITRIEVYFNTARPKYSSLDGSELEDPMDVLTEIATNFLANREIFLEDTEIELEGIEKTRIVLSRLVQEVDRYSN